MSDTPKRPDMEELATMSPEEFDQAMLVHFDPMSFAEILKAYPEQVADQLEDEGEAAQHLCKWLGVGGGVLPAEHLRHRLDRIAGRVRLQPERQRKKAIDALIELERCIAGDGPVVLNLLLHPEIRHSLKKLGEILDRSPLADERDRSAGAPPQAHTYAATSAIVEFFPPSYPTKKAAQVFVQAWQQHEVMEDVEHRTKLSVESIRKTMEASRKAAAGNDDGSDTFERWRSGRLRK